MKLIEEDVVNIMVIMKMIGNSISTFKGGYKKWFLFAARKKKGLALSPQGKMNE